MKCSPKYLPASRMHWGALVTLATVGYGDGYPVTAIGRLLSGLVFIVGIVIFALPAALFASGFVEEIQKNQEHTAPVA